MVVKAGLRRDCQRMTERRLKAHGLRLGALQHQEVQEKEDCEGVVSEVLEFAVFWKSREEKCFQEEEEEEEVVCVEYCWLIK